MRYVGGGFIGLECDINQSLKFNPPYYWSMGFLECLMSRESNSLAKGCDTTFLY